MNHEYRGDDDIVRSCIVGSNMADERSASGSMTGERHTATDTQLPTAAAGVSGDINRTLSELQ